jgi:predicted ATPase
MRVSRADSSSKNRVHRSQLSVREHTFDLPISWLLRSANGHRVAAVWEDLHWAKPSPLGLLNRVIDQGHTAPLFMVLACRPEFRQPWSPTPIWYSSRLIV